MAKRKIIEILEDKCNGCGKCIPDCPEGALQIIDGKARLVSDLFCDGLGACIGSCPLGAIKVVEREAEPYNESKVIKRIAEQGPNVIKAHLEHLKRHSENAFLNQALSYLKKNNIENPLEAAVNPLPCGCPGANVRVFEKKQSSEAYARQDSELRLWPVQLALVPPMAPYFKDADIVVAADCVPFAYANFHSDFLKAKALVIGCPKLDDIDMYREKLAGIFRLNNVKSVTVLHMEVPCCYGLYRAVEDAIRESGKKIPLLEKTITLQGDAR